MARTILNPSQTSNKERTSVLLFKRGSITVEAALSVPIFFFALLCMVYLLEITAVKTYVRMGMQAAGKEIAKEVYTVPVTSVNHIQNQAVEAIGRERLDRSMITGGSNGLSFYQSYIEPKTGIVHLKVSYRMKLPIPVMRIGELSFQDDMICKGWNGYVGHGFNKTEEELVYITETGLVYHRSYQCTYLELSIRMVSKETLTELRNNSGGKYYPCERCRNGYGAGGNVYITGTGDRYHNSIGCSGLKRTVYAVPVTEAIGKGECSRCGQ